jgi:hypothetical protein
MGSTPKLSLPNVPSEKFVGSPAAALGRPRPLNVLAIRSRCAGKAAPDSAATFRHSHDEGGTASMTGQRCHQVTHIIAQSLRVWVINHLE